ncbi:MULTISPECIES: glycosyltransferase [unclassified Shewanella]|uniref:glycosyltransferase n=1 Tax=unclassified Shewanella TaxID=196818 RepID=UPI0021D8008B|nr:MULTISPECIES: glycosyltransferase [unclassified Shewanella]MCU8021996.1 glycosyltransferase [Shewanella sp. SM78]MCU8079286.1 glycosyltransferase [Shewanella sp. SM103]
MGRILIVTIRSKGGGAEKIIEKIINSGVGDFKWINMESFLSLPFFYKYAKFIFLIYQNISHFDKVLIGTEGVLGLLVFPFKFFYRKKFILWNHCYFNDYKFFLNKKNQVLYRICYAIYPFRINASPASEIGTFVPNPYFFRDFCAFNHFLNNSEITLLSVSSLAKLKRVDLTIKLLQNLPANINLNIYGVGIERQNLECLANNEKTQNRIKFLGYHNNPFEIEANIPHILIVNSQTEALPTIILEAVEHFIPVIVSAYTGAEYWFGVKSVFVLEEITSEKTMEIIDYFKKMNDAEYYDLFSSDIEKLKEQHNYVKFIHTLEQF